MSRHYDQQRPWACLACPHVAPAPGPFCRPLHWSRSVSLRPSTRLRLLFLPEGAVGKLLWQLFSLMAKSTHFIFALMSPLMWTGRGAWGFASARLASGCPGRLACGPGPGSPSGAGTGRHGDSEGCSSTKLWQGEAADQPGGWRIREVSLSFREAGRDERSLLRRP